MSRAPTPSSAVQPSRPSPEPESSSAGLPPGEPGLSIIKPAVRRQAGYTLRSPLARRKLNQNESPFDFPPELKREVLERALGLPWQRYPEFVPVELRERLAEFYGWIPEGVLVGNGSNELIQASLAVTLEPGDRLVAPAPTFSLYRLLTGVLGGRYVPVGLGPDYAYDVDALAETAARERARVVVLNSPNNPTGSALPAGGVERLLERTDALILCDEAYQDFGGPSAIGLLRQSSRVVVLRTFSKAFGLAGLRFGLALAHPSVTQELAKGKLPYNVNVVTLAAAATALGHAQLLGGRVQEIVETRERFLAGLRRLRGIRTFPSAANFVLIRCEAVPAAEMFRRLLDDHGILVRDVSNLAELPECLRISIGTPEDMEAVVGAVGTILEGASGER